MSTDEQSTQGSDSQGDHQTQQDGQNSQSDHSEQSNEFDARRAFNSTNERVNKIAAVVEKIDPEVISQIAEKLGVSKQEAKEKVETQSPDVQAIVKDQLWLDKHDSRITAVKEQYDGYIAEGIKPAHALRLAEQDAGIQVDNSAQKKQQKNSAAEASIDRSDSASQEYTAGDYGITAKDIEKYGPRAAQVKIHR